MADTQNPTVAQAHEPLLSRTFDAPRALVFKAYTQAEHLVHWWAPKGFTVEVHHLDVRPGGTFHYCQKNDQMTMWGKFEYREIQAPERLVFVSGFSDAEGNWKPNPFAPVWPLQILNDVVFTEENGKTTITMYGGPINATVTEIEAYRNARPQMQAGFKGTLDGLEAYLATIKE
jgi:uncharacterized protein YndB with AHSA1/START domain